jgi:adenylate kinase family enzyme
VKIMIFGDSGAGKSTFAKKLGTTTGLDVLHLDEVMEKMGREDRAAIGEFIAKETAKAKWIMDGNAFTKDKHARIAAADLIIVFDINRFHALARHIARYIKLRTGKQTVTGGHSAKLMLSYYIPYILWQFPGRKKAAIDRAKASGTPMEFVRSWRQADELVGKIGAHND